METYRGPKERLDAARHVATPSGELRNLAQSTYDFVREAVAANPSTPGDVLMELTPSTLVEDNDFKIALALLRNPSTSEGVIVELAGMLAAVISDVEPRANYPAQVLAALFASPNAPLSSLQPLVDSESVPTYVRGRIASEHTRPEILEVLLSDPSDNVKRRAKRALDRQEGVEQPPAAS